MLFCQYYTWSEWILTVIGRMHCFSTKALWWYPPKNLTSYWQSLSDPVELGKILMTLAGQYGNPFCLAYTWRDKLTCNMKFLKHHHAHNRNLDYLKYYLTCVLCNRHPYSIHGISPKFIEQKTKNASFWFSVQ